MKTELSKLIDKWEIEKGSYIPNAPIYQAFIDEAKEALERESKVNNVVLDDVNKWVAISNFVSPDRLSDVLARLQDGRELKLEFECDGRFYKEDGTDLTDEIIEWKQL